MSQDKGKISDQLSEQVLKTLSSLEIHLDDASLNQIIGYLVLLSKWNLRLKFSKFKTYSDLFFNLIVPSLAHSKLLPNKGKLVDIGSGPGIPGLVTAILKPELYVTCLDSSDKAFEFLKTCRESLRIENLDTNLGRVELFARNTDFRGRYDLLVARAFAPLPVLLEVSSAFIKVDGSLVLQISSEKISRSPAPLEVLQKIGLTYSHTDISVLPPPSPSPVSFMTFRKTETTPFEFPRKWKTIEKSPLW